MGMSPEDKVRLPVVAAGAEHLVMGCLMRRNILAYKAPQNHEGYDLIAIHPDPRHRPRENERAQVRIQVKSRFQTDCNRVVPLKAVSLEAFDFLAVVFMNIGKYYGRHDGSAGEKQAELYMLPTDFVRGHHRADRKVQTLPLTHVYEEIQRYRDERGVELVAEALGVARPVRGARAAARRVQLGR